MGHRTIFKPSSNGPTRVGVSSNEKAPAPLPAQDIYLMAGFENSTTEWRLLTCFRTERAHDHNAIESSRRWQRNHIFAIGSHF
jgi:hypothetical protein